MRRLIILTLFLLWQSIGSHGHYTCEERITVSGVPASPKSWGVFVSENFPHALPFGSNCVHRFQIKSNVFANAFCLQFKELDLFTDNAKSAEETTIQLANSYYLDPVLVYSGNGSLLRESQFLSKFLITKPSNLLNGALCLTLPHFTTSYSLTVTNRNFIRSELQGLRRFLAEFSVVNITTDNRNSTRDYKAIQDQHRCLNGDFVNKSKRCDRVKDCQGNAMRDFALKRKTDFFFGTSSDESYEHARCSSFRNFGTNFVRGQINAHEIADSSVSHDCSLRSDHSRYFSYLSDGRDCSLVIPSSPQSAIRSLPLLLLYGIEMPIIGVKKSTCYRFYWTSSGFDSPFQSITLASSVDNRALLRLTGRYSSATWSMVEFEMDNQKGYVNVFLRRSENRTGYSPRHWIDDLSAEPIACNSSAYETHMPTVCPLEWSTCGWESNMPVVTDTGISSVYGVGFQDHTSDSLPYRSLPPKSQRVLKLQPSSGNWSNRLVSNRQLPYNTALCFGIWFYGLGDSGYSFQFDARVEVMVDDVMIPSPFLVKTTAPKNKWRFLAVDVNYTMSGIPKLTVGLRALQQRELQVVLLDDITVYSGACSGYERRLNGTVECDRKEWRCSNGLECILLDNRCDGIIDCDDYSDEMNCSSRNRSDSFWALILRVVVGVVGAVCAVMVICTYLRCRSEGRQRRRNRGGPPTVTNGRLPAELHSDRPRRLPDMPPSYRDVIDGEENAGFAVDEEPPKYEDAVTRLADNEAETRQV